MNPLKNRHLKKPLTLVVLSIVLTSCYTFKNISKGKPLTENKIQENVIPGNTYRFKLNNGILMDVYVTSVDSNHIYGTEKLIFNHKSTSRPFSDSYKNLSVNTSKISVYKLNPYLTVAGGILIINVLYLLIYAISYL